VVVRASSPFLADDLAEFDALLSRASEVVTMHHVNEWQRRDTIALRHDVDNRFDPCVDLAEWEAERGYHATYFILHDSPYWNSPELRPGLERIAELGHEIALHTNALSVALQTGRCPHEIVAGALDRLRYWGHDVTGVVAHGDPLCYAAKFVNDETFEECARPDWGAPDRNPHLVGVAVTLVLHPLAASGLEYVANGGPRGDYLSDSGGRWSQPFEETASRFPLEWGSLHILLHPCWWVEAFAKVPA